jgi:hypothetical protein
MAERKSWRFLAPLTHSCQFAISRSAPVQQIFPRSVKCYETTASRQMCRNGGRRALFPERRTRNHRREPPVVYSLPGQYWNTALVRKDAFSNEKSSARSHRRIQGQDHFAPAEKATPWTGERRPAKNVRRSAGGLTHFQHRVRGSTLIQLTLTTQSARAQSRRKRFAQAALSENATPSSHCWSMRLPISMNSACALT